MLNHDIWTHDQKTEALQLKGPILIIGASGFIGSKLFLSLSSLRSDVYGASKQILSSWRLSAHSNLIQPGHLLNLDITDRNQVHQAIQKLRPRTIFNLASYGNFERQKDVQQIHQVNYIGTVNLIEAAQTTGCDAFVQAGSSSEYGLNSQAPLESASLEPNSDYSVSKGSASLLIQYYGNVQKFPCAHLRFYSVYGPYEEPERLIPQVISKGLQKKYPAFVDPDISRDFVYIDDCTSALVKAALTVCQNDLGISLNIGTGIKTTLKEVALAAQELFAIPYAPEFNTMKNRRWDMANWYSNSNLALQKMNWKAQTHFLTGLTLTKDWIQNSRTGLAPQKNLTPSARRISAIVACYKDNQAIPIMHQRLTETFKNLDVDYEIIFVNDHSPTSDEDEIKKLAATDSKILGITHSRNFGSQSAFISGLEIATGDAAVLLDGDLQDPPELIKNFVAKWSEGFEVVYGVRTAREATLFMQIMYKSFYRVFNKLCDVNMPLHAGDFSLIDRKVINQLLALSEKDVFLRGLRAWVGFRQTGVEYKRPERLFGVTTNSFLKNIWWAKKAIFSFSQKPLSYIQGLGLGIFLVSVVLMLGYLALFLMSTRPAPPGITTIILLVLSLGGIQLFSLSILGEYISKIFDEVKNRPRYIRSKLIVGNNIIEDEVQIQKFLEERK